MSGARHAAGRRPAQAVCALGTIEILRGIVPTETDCSSAIVPAAAGRRLSTQVARAYRGTYGARIGLRTLVKSVSVQMVRNGLSPDAVARALAEYVVSCPAPTGCDPSNARDEALRAGVLAELVAEYGDPLPVHPNRVPSCDGRRGPRAISHGGLL